MLLTERHVPRLSMRLSCDYLAPSAENKFQLSFVGNIRRSQHYLSIVGESKVFEAGENMSNYKQAESSDLECGYARRPL